jgi:hypothetical protein
MRHAKNFEVRIIATSPHQVVSAFIAMGLFPFLARIMSSICRLIVDARRGFGLEEDTIRNHWNLDEAAAGESVFQFGRFLVFIVLHHPLNIVTPLVVSSKYRAKQ